VNARQRCRICVDLDPGKLSNGAQYRFDPPVVSHWAQWLGHQEPQLLIVGQDFGNGEYFAKHRGNDDPENLTNRNLRILLGIAGITVAQPPDRDSAAPIYLTNAILCMKEGPMNAPIKTRWINMCAEKHLVPLAVHLRPRIVVGMGRGGWKAVRKAFNLVAAPVNISEVAGTMWHSVSGVRVFAVGHCGPLGKVNRPWALQEEDWRRIGTSLQEISPQIDRASP